MLRVSLLDRPSKNGSESDVTAGGNSMKLTALMFMPTFLFFIFIFFYLK